AAGALLVLGQRRSRDRGAHLRARRSSHAPIRRISGVGCLGGRAHLFPDRVREPILRYAAMGTDVSDQTSAGADLSGTRTSRRGSIGPFTKRVRREICFCRTQIALDNKSGGIPMAIKYDAIVIGTGQAGPSL